MQLKNKKLNKYLPSFLAGVLGALGLVAIYVLIMFLATRDFGQIVGQFIFFKYWLAALIIGFGVQMGLFWYIRSGMHLTDGSSKTTLAANASISTTAMVACCAHHLTDFLPILGLSAVSLFLSQYQIYFFTFGIFFNIIGIILMIYIIKTKKCPDFFGFFKKHLI